MLVLNWDVSLFFLDSFNDEDEISVDPASLPLLISYIYSYILTCLVSYIIIYCYNYKKALTNDYSYLIFITWICIAMTISIYLRVLLGYAFSEELEHAKLSNHLWGVLSITGMLVFTLNTFYTFYACTLKSTIKKIFLPQQLFLYAISIPLIIRFIAWPIEFYIFNQAMFVAYENVPLPTMEVYMQQQ